ncbi:7079_t:CDS:1, partial [Dentiscutata heterogama]
MPSEHAPEGHAPERHAPEGHNSSISAAERSLIYSIIENVLLIIYRVFMNILLFIIHIISYITHELLSSPGITTSPYYLSASILVDEKYEPIFKFLLVELSPVITILYPIISYMLPYDILKSFDDDLAITILSPVILHIKKPEYHYQGITDSMASIINSSYKLFHAHYYGITEEEEKKIVESPMFKKMKYEIELDEDFVNSIDISYMIPESIMNTYQRYAEPEEMDRSSMRQSRSGEAIAEI